MHYQVVARSCKADGTWEYYPYWAPLRDKGAATRLATYAANTGYEAAILQSVTTEMLRLIARRVVDRQDDQMLPALRYLPGVPLEIASGHPKHALGTALQDTEIDPYATGPQKIQLDGRRLNIEMGLGGDVTQQAGWQGHIAIPCRMDVLRSWLSLRERMLQGHLGGVLDGAPTSDVEDD